MIKQACAVMALAALSACASTPMVFRCNDLRTAKIQQPVPTSAYIKTIQTDARPDGTSVKAFADMPTAGFAEEDLRAFIAANPEAFGLKPSTENGLVEQWEFTERDGPEKLLALSGGGQWGAFGAGFFDQLEKDGNLPLFDRLTGVSTGAMQVLFLAAANTEDPDKRRRYLEELVDAYTIDAEKEIVDRGSKATALVRGSIAKLGPLRKLVERKLCASEEDCPLIRDIAGAEADAFVGYVDAESGDFVQANVTAIARQYASGEKSAREARDCMAGVAMASAAVPAFYQQIQIESHDEEGLAERRTVFDGGVRQSVFFALHAEAMRYVAELRSEQVKAAGQAATAGVADLSTDLYLVRNGPSVAEQTKEANQPRSVLGNGLHAYSLIVNQTEITSLEVMHLLYSGGKESRLVTADQAPSATPGYDKYGAKLCLREGKERAIMFLPRHMACLRELGRKKAQSGSPWITLPPPPANP